MSDDSLEEPGLDPEPAGPTRYGFGGALADSWDVFRSHIGITLALFATFHVLGALFSFSLLLAASSLGEIAVIPARLMALVVIPVLAGSLAVAALSRHVLEGDPLTPTHNEAEPRRPLLRSDILGLALVATAGGVAAVLLLRGYAILVLPFFYGPPIAMQLAVTTGLSLAESLRAARATLEGHWNVLLYLFAVAIVLGILGIVAVGGLLSLAAGRTDLGTATALSLGRGLVIGLFAGFLGAMQVAIFTRLEESAAVTTGGAASPD